MHAAAPTVTLVGAATAAKQHASAAQLGHKMSVLQQQQHLLTQLTQEVLSAQRQAQQHAHALPRMRRG
jgi:hypothetical protein